MKSVAILISVLLSSAALANDYVTWRAGVDEAAAVMLSADTYDSLEWGKRGYEMELIAKIAVTLAKMREPSLIAATPAQYADFLEKVNALEPNKEVRRFFRQANIRWGTTSFARDYGPIFLKNGWNSSWSSMISAFGSDDQNDQSMGRWFQMHAGVPILGRVGDGLPTAGGNLLMDSARHCFSAGIEHPAFRAYLACADVTVIPCASLVCHIDEYLTFPRPGVALTTLPSLVDTLRRLGYSEIRVLPAMKDPHAVSFANVLVVGNAVIFYYTDAESASELATARAAYESLGFQVAGIHTTKYTGGGVHCMTKEIPRAIWNRLERGSFHRSK